VVAGLEVVAAQAAGGRLSCIDRNILLVTNDLGAAGIYGSASASHCPTIYGAKHATHRTHGFSNGVSTDLARVFWGSVAVDTTLAALLSMGGSKLHCTAFVSSASSVPREELAFAAF